MDNKQIEDILNKGLLALKKDVLENLYKKDRVASGKTANSIKVSTSISGNIIKGLLLGSSVLEQLEYGRGKTKNGGATRTWEKELKAWMRIRGIEESAFYPIWRKINRDGYKGTKGLVSDPVSKFADNISKALKVEIIKDFKRNVINGNQ